MSTTRARSRALAGVLTALLLAVAGCSQDESSDDSTGDAPSSPASTGRAQAAPGDGARKEKSTRVPPDLSRTITRLLDRRAGAVLDGDAAAYDSVLGDDPAFRVAQRGYYANLRQLPLDTFAYTLDPASLVRTGDSYWVVVDVALRLDGFDEAAVHTPDRFRFSPAPRGRGLRLTSVTDGDWETAHHVLNQPWDVEPVTVRRADGVLAVFDERSAASADAVVSSVARGISDVRGVVPYGEWSGDVVVYALSTTEFIGSLEHLPGGDPDALDGVTFTLPASARDPSTAATRVALNPRLLTVGRVERDRLVRHELTHVAVGDHDDRAPLWLSEGLAEYVSVRPLAPQDRRLDSDALLAAESGDLVHLPEDEDFNDADDADVNYALSWWVCESLAKTYGEAALWTLLDELDEPGVDPGTEVKELLGTTRSRLAKRGAALMVRTYAPPEQSHSEDQPTTPSEESGDPSDGPSDDPSHHGSGDGSGGGSHD